MAHYALWTGLTALAVTGAIGLYFCWAFGWKFASGLLPLGVLGMVVIVAYTPWFTRQSFLCLIAPGLGFGTLMVMGTHYVLTRGYSWTAFIASLVPFFLVNNLLLLNQFPDLEADRSVGRKHILIVRGVRSGGIIYALFLLGTYLAIIGGVLCAKLPLLSLLGLLTIALAIPAARGCFRYAKEVGKLLPYQGFNVIINLATPVLVAVGLFVGK